MSLEGDLIILKAKLTKDVEKWTHISHMVLSKSIGDSIYVLMCKPNGNYSHTISDTSKKIFSIIPTQWFSIETLVK